MEKIVSEVIKNESVSLAYNKTIKQAVFTFLFGNPDLANFFESPASVYEPDSKLSIDQIFKQNPINYLILNFAEEIDNSKSVIDVETEPEQEPYLSFAEFLELRLKEIHHKSKKDSLIKNLTINLLTEGLVVAYLNKDKYEIIKPSEFFVGHPKEPFLEKQPFVVRKTYLTASKFASLLEKDKQNRILSYYKPDDEICVFVVYSKDDRKKYWIPKGLNEIVKEFPFDGDYPFRVCADRETLETFYPIPLVLKIYPTLKENQEFKEFLSNHFKRMCSGIITIDKEARINQDLLNFALRENFRNIVLEKSRDGNIDVIKPPEIPVEELKLIQDQDLEIQKHIGILDYFLGKGGSVREKGAMSLVFSGALRRIKSKANLLLRFFEEIDEYYLNKFLKENKLAFDGKTISEYFNKAIFRPKEKFIGFSNEDPEKLSALVLRKYKGGLLSKRRALRELGEERVNTLIREIEKEREEMLRQELELKEKYAQEIKGEDIISQIEKRVKSQTDIYELVKTPEGKIEVRVLPKDVVRVSFALADYSDLVRIRKLVEEKKKEEETLASSKEEKLKEIQNLIRLTLKYRKTIPYKSVYENLPILYLVEPHAKMILKGDKLLIVKSKKFDIVGKIFRLAGDKVYGLIKIEAIFRNLDFDKTQKWHRVSRKEAKRWWKGFPQRTLYYYLFTFYPFPKSIEYKLKKGVQTFQKGEDKNKKLIEELKEELIKVTGEASIQEGDLKKIKIKPFVVPPPHKPEKKALSSNEVFSIERLKEIVPEGTYDVSPKWDGMLAYCWKKGKDIRFFSETGGKISNSRIEPIVKTLSKVRHDFLIVGEIIAEKIPRQNLVGYLHSKKKPTKEELESVRFPVWDLLYLDGEDLSNKPFSDRSFLLGKLLKNLKSKYVFKTPSVVVKRNQIPDAIKKMQSNEGAFIRSTEASYWATHLSFKFKKLYDIDAKVIGVERTKTGLPIFHCVLGDGTYIGQTYAQEEVKAKPGDVIRVNVQHITIRPDGSIGWYAPRPKSQKAKYLKVPSKTQTTVLIGKPDTLALAKEIYLASGGTLEEWKKWLPKFAIWRKTKMKKIIEEIKKKYG